MSCFVCWFRFGEFGDKDKSNQHYIRIKNNVITTNKVHTCNINASHIHITITEMAEANRLAVDVRLIYHCSTTVQMSQFLMKSTFLCTLGLVYIYRGLISRPGLYVQQRQFGCGNLRMVGPKKQDFCNVVTRFQGFHLIF